MLKTYDPNAATKYIETEATYFEECGRHYEQGRKHADHNGPSNLGRLYAFYNMRLRNLLFQQFSEAADLENYDTIHRILPHTVNSHLRGIRHMMISDILLTARGFLPNMPKGHDPFSTSHFEINTKWIDLKISPFQAVSALAIVATNPDQSAVCFTHRPGFTGMSPTNAAEELAKHAREVFLSDYKPEQVRIFTHVPSEVGDRRERMFEVTIGKVASFRPVSHKPNFFNFGLFNALALPETIESEVKKIAASEEAVDWDYIRDLEKRHSAQVHRRYLAAL